MATRIKVGDLEERPWAVRFEEVDGDHRGLNFHYGEKIVDPEQIRVLLSLIAMVPIETINPQQFRQLESMKELWRRRLRRMGQTPSLESVLSEPSRPRKIAVLP